MEAIKLDERNNGDIYSCSKLGSIRIEQGFPSMKKGKFIEKLFSLISKLWGEY
jgi:hypothetical protein